MELVEPIETINQRLRDHFGAEWDNRPMWRVVWAEDQFEKRLINSYDGVQLLFPEVREVRKYNYITGKYILEHLVEVPGVNKEELPTTLVSYECMWVFEDKNHNYLPPLWDAAKFVIDTVNAALGKKSLAGYAEKGPSAEDDERRISKLQEDLFGNENDPLAYGGGVAGYHPNEDMQSKIKDKVN